MRSSVFEIVSKNPPDHWEEAGLDLDWGDEIDGLNLEVEVNAELVNRFRELAQAD